MRRFLLFFCVVVLVSGCVSSPGKTGTVYQASTINALLAGIYDGEVTLRQVLVHGDFGLGTYNHLAGEMILDEGRFYQILPDGRAYQPDLSAKTPFVTVCRFESDASFSAPASADMAAVKAFLDRRLPDQNLFYAIKITGVFRTMEVRTIVAQKKPYPPLREVVKHQVVFHMEEVPGTIVGFRCPGYIRSINVPRYHFHFISRDRSRGGHVLGFDLETGRVETETLNRFLLVLPLDSEEFAKADLSGNRDKALERVERK